MATGNLPSLQFYTRLETLKRKHAILDQQIAKEERNPNTADYYLKQLKRQKLLLRDQMEDIVRGLRNKSANAC